MFTVADGSGYGEHKALVTVMLWGGAVLAIAGLWVPNWIAALAGGGNPFLGLAIFRTPVITYLGDIVLWLACILVLGIQGIGSGYITWVGLSSIVIAITSSVLAQVRASPSLILLLITIAAFLATFFIYWTLEKIEEIRRLVKRAVFGMNLMAIILGIAAVVLGLSSSNDVALLLIYSMAGCYTLTWLMAAVSILPSHYRSMIGKKVADKV